MKVFAAELSCCTIMDICRLKSKRRKYNAAASMPCELKDFM